MDSNAARLNVRQDPVQLEVGYRLKSDIDNGPASIAVTNAAFMTGLPIFRGESAALMVNAQYAYDRIDLRDLDETVLRDGSYDLHSFGLGLIYMHALSDNWIVMAMALANASSDFREVDADALFLQGVLGANWAINDSWALNFGVAVHNRFGWYMPIPRLGFVYRPRGGWLEIEAMLPKVVRVTAHTTSWLDLELFGGLEGKVWDVNRKNLGNRAMIMKVTTGAGAKVKVFDGVFLRLAGGVLPFTRVRSFGDSDDDSYDANTWVAPFVQAQLLLNPRDWFASPPEAVQPLMARR